MAVKGYRYFFALHMGIGRGPVDELVEIKVGGKTAWRGSVLSSQTVQVSARTLFGGEDGEGGVEGPLTVLMGNSDQQAPAEMVATFGPQPGFRRTFTAFFDGLVSMMNPYPKPWSFRHRRALAGWDGAPWYPERAVITLVRPVSIGETPDSTEGATAQQVETFRFNLPTPFTFTISPPGPLVSVEVLWYSVIEQEGTTPVQLSAGIHYTVAGNVITLTPAGAMTVAGGDDEAVARTTFSVSYTYILSTNGPGATLGDAVIKAMNPAHIIYECLTNREWGRGLPRNKIDDAVFRKTADTLFIEQFGMCIRWNRRDEIQSFIRLIQDHIGATLYEDRTTGLIKLDLIRANYDLALLPLFDSSSGLIEISEATVSSSTKMVNEVRVKYRDPVTNEDRISRASSLATLQASGGVINVMTKDMPGLPTAELASRVAKRELRALSPGLRRFTLKFDRRGNDLVPGGVVRIRDLVRNIPDMVLRIATIDYGTLTNGEINVTAVQDVFDTPRESYPVISPPTWIPPSNRACVGNFRLYELPYRTIYRQLSRAEFALVDNTSAYLGLALDRGVGNVANATTDIAVKSGAIGAGEVPTNSDGYCGYVAP
jgi:hypothetical protein